METVMMAAVGLQVVGSITSGMQQADALEQQSAMMESQARIYGAQVQMEADENDRRVAIEKAAVAQESMDRTERLRRIVGATVAQGAAAGISTQYGSITSLNEYNSSQAAIDERIARDNSKNRIVSLNLNSAINQLNSAVSARQSGLQAGQLQNQAGQAMVGGFMRAGESLISYGMSQYNRGSVPTAKSASKTTYSDWEMWAGAE